MGRKRRQEREISRNAATGESGESGCKGRGTAVHKERVWLYKDVEEANKKNNIRIGANLQAPPAHWPPTIKVHPGVWARWLPDDWGQGLKPQSTGDRLVFTTPTGKV